MIVLCSANTAGLLNAGKRVNREDRSLKKFTIQVTIPLLALLLLGATPHSVGAAEDSDFEVIMLGTGTPPPFMHRFGPSTLVRVNGKMLLFDVGRGATQRLWQKKIRLGAIDQVFLTHLHSDHVVGMPDLMLTGWLTSPFGRRKGPLKVSGPPGTVKLRTHLEKAYAWDIETRIEDQKFSRDNVRPEASDLEPGVVYDQDGIKITVFLVDHGDLIKSVFGYRIDYDGRSMVLTGDTRYSDNTVKNSTGVDLLIHTVAAIRQELLESAASWQRIMDHHSEPEDAGRVFAQAKPKLAAYTHVVLLTNGKIKPPTVEDLIRRTRTEYDGPLVVGEDLMRFVIAKDGVKVITP
jgi:ribonuclease Z